VALSTVLRRCAPAPWSPRWRVEASNRLLFWPGAFLSIFMECKRSFLFYFGFFFVKLKQKIYILYLSLHT
jgi:hypothetical protein